MTTQNLISASLSVEDAAEITQKIAEIRAKLPFLLTLDSDQVRSLRKVSNGFRPFVDKAHAVATTNREILPPVFPYEEFNRDFELAKTLSPIQQELEKLASAVQDTLLAANSDALAEAMEVYGAVKAHQNKVPGLNVAHDELSVFFQRTRRKETTPSAN